MPVLSLLLQYQLRQSKIILSLVTLKEWDTVSVAIQLGVLNLHITYLHIPYSKVDHPQHLVCDGNGSVADSGRPTPTHQLMDSVELSELWRRGTTVHKSAVYRYLLVWRP